MVQMSSGREWRGMDVSGYKSTHVRENCIPGTIALMCSERAPGRTATSSDMT